MTGPSSQADPEDWGHIVDYRTVLLQFVGSLTLCDHMGDVADDIAVVLKKIDIDIEDWDDMTQLREHLSKHGVTTTLHGTSLL